MKLGPAPLKLKPVQYHTFKEALHPRGRGGEWIQIGPRPGGRA